MISLRVNDVVFLEELGVHVLVEDMMFEMPPAPSIEVFIDKNGHLFKEIGQQERPKVIVKMSQVDPT